MTTTEERMETLEKQVRRQRRWNIALGVVVVVGGLMAAKGIQEVPDVIRAKSFEVVDQSGKILMGLGVNKAGGGILSAFNKDSEMIGVFGTSVNSGGFMYLASSSKMPAVLAESSSQGGVVNVFNNSGVPTSLSPDKRLNTETMTPAPTPDP